MMTSAGSPALSPPVSGPSVARAGAQAATANSNAAASATEAVVARVITVRPSLATGTSARPSAGVQAREHTPFGLVRRSRHELGTGEASR